MVNRYNNRCGTDNRGGSGRMPFSEVPRDINMPKENFRGNWPMGQQYTRSGIMNEPLRSNMRQNGPVMGDIRGQQYGPAMQNPIQTRQGVNPGSTRR
ncbi:MAG: hypothetical protein WCP73_00545 [Eubacteriales bacterium]